MRAPASLLGPWPWARWTVGLALLASLMLPGPAAGKSATTKAPADYFVHSLPGAPAGVPLVKMHAGHIEVTPDHHGHLFFWHFQNRHIADRQRTVIWLNGGPGCSSEDGALMEIGPYRVRQGGKLEEINGTWNEFANLLFVDNPVGTGFSYVATDSYVTELQQMADQFMTFLSKWFDLFPEYMHDDIYIAGESYAGQHIPYITRAILDRNKRAAEHAKWNLKGILIGNGWIQGTTQYPAYLRYAYDHGLLIRGSSGAQAVEAKMNTCSALLNSGGGNRVDVPECEAVLSEILFQTSTVDGGNRMCYNMYDVRLKDRHPSCGMSWPPDLEHVTPYLRQKDVIQALHIDRNDAVGWQECNGQVGQAFRAINSDPAFKLLPGILSEIPVVLFSGEQDLICNHLGTEELIHGLEWNGGKGFELGTGNWAPRRAWTFENQPAGFYQSARNLTYILFYNSSHMVPFNHPRRTRDMLDRFMGVDIGPIGGRPVVSVIDGETAPVTSVGGTPNSTQAQKEQGERIKDAEWKAYRKSGEVVLVIVALAAAAWGVFVCRARIRGRGAAGARSAAGYKGLWTNDPDEEEGQGDGLGLDDSARRRAKRRANGDVEAGDFDETRLRDDEDDDADHVERQGGEGSIARVVAEARDARFSVGEDSEAEGDRKDGG